MSHAPFSFTPVTELQFPEYPPPHDACTPVPDLVSELSRLGKQESDVVFTVTAGGIMHLASLRSIATGCGVVAVNLEL